LMPSRRRSSPRLTARSPPPVSSTTACPLAWSTINVPEVGKSWRIMMPDTDYRGIVDPPPGRQSVPAAVEIANIAGRPGGAGCAAWVVDRDRMAMWFCWRASGPSWRATGHRPDVMSYRTCWRLVGRPAN